MFIGCQQRNAQTQSARQEKAAALELVQKANRLFLQQRYEAALEFADSAEVLADDVPNVHFMQGLILYKLQRFDSSLVAFNRTRELEPEFKGVNSHIGTLYLREHKFNQAIHWYHRELANHPSPEVWINIGITYADKHVSDSARYAYQQAIALDSTNAIAHMALSEEWKNTGQFEKAIQHAKKAVELAPQETTYQVAYGLLLYQTGDTEQAIQWLKRALEKRPWDYRAHYALGRAYTRLQQKAKASWHLALADSLRDQQFFIDRLRRQVRMAPESITYWGILGNTLKRAGRYSEAMDALQAAYTLEPGNLYIQENLAEIYELMGDTVHAIQQYQQMLREDSTAVEHWERLASLLQAAGHFTEARRAWRQVLRYTPNSKRARRELQDLSMVNR